MDISPDQAVESVQQYKYLGTFIDDRLSFEPHVDAMCGKTQQCMYFYRKLQRSNVDNTFVKMFYSCFIESVIIVSFVSWYGLLNLKNRNRLQGIVIVSVQHNCTTLYDLPYLHKVRTLKKAQSILVDPSHPLSKQFKLLPSDRGCNLPSCRANRLKTSFVPAAISLLNTSIRFLYCICCLLFVRVIYVFTIVCRLVM